MDSEPDPLAGKLLLAHPGLKDANFSRSIIHLVEHDGNGTLGFILNRPTGQTLGDIAVEPLAVEMADIPVYLGGPVAPNQIIVARISWDTGFGTIDFTANLDPDSPGEMDLGGPGELRAFLGYSGWSENQLAGELRQNTWIIHEPHPSVIEASTATWKKLLSALGPEWHLLAETPDHPEFN